MRKIKFRIWNPKEKIMYYQPFELDFIKDGHIELNKWLKSDMYSTKIGCTGKKCMLGVSLVLMQYVGIKDKNKKEIYEGDIIQDNSKKNKYLAEIVYQAEHMRFVVKGKTSFISMLMMANITKYKVVGNIYENKGLLKCKK